MQQSHGMGFAEYERKLDKRLMVEKRRQRDYEECKHMLAGLDTQLHR